MIVENAKRNGVVINNTYNSYYNIEIGKTGEVNGQDNGAGILPNKSYKISLAVAGIGGGEGGDRPILNVKTEVSDWDEVSHSGRVIAFFKISPEVLPDREHFFVFMRREYIALLPSALLVYIAR